MSQASSVASGTGQPTSVISIGNVRVHPSARDSATNIPGVLSIVREPIPDALHNDAQRGGSDFAESNAQITRNLSDDASVTFIQWIPDAEDDNAQQYALKIPVGSLHSVRRVPPSVRVHPSCIFMPQNGVCCPPLYFHGGSGDAAKFFDALHAHVALLHAVDDPTLIYASAVHEMDRAEAASDTRRGLSASTLDGLHSYEARLNLEQDSETQRSHNAADDLTDATWQLLDAFSKVTRFARDTTRNFLLGRGTTSGKSGQRSGAAREVSSSLPGDATLVSPSLSPFRPLHKGHSGSHRARDRRATSTGVHDTDVGTFEVLHTEHSEPVSASSSATGSVELDATGQAAGAIARQQPPLKAREWMAFFDDEGRITDPGAVRKRVFYGGVDPAIRGAVWEFLCGYQCFEHTHEERLEFTTRKREEYVTLKQEWLEITSEQLESLPLFKERKHRVEKDVCRTDRSLSFFADDEGENLRKLNDILVTYTRYNESLGYCQGMNDILAPILYLVENEGDAFWCFAGVMETLQDNFRHDQSGISRQLFMLANLTKVLDRELYVYFSRHNCLNFFFCFRWVLIWFKREFTTYEEVHRLWEVLMSHHLYEHFHLLVCLAILRQHRQHIMSQQMRFDDMVRFCNSLSGNLDLNQLLFDAESLFYHLEALARAET